MPLRTPCSQIYQKIKILTFVINLISEIVQVELDTRGEANIPFKHNSYLNKWVVHPIAHIYIKTFRTPSRLNISAQMYIVNFQQK